MSFNLASLIAGTSGTPTIVSVTKSPSVVSPQVKPSPQAVQKKGFTHGVNIIFNNGTYKGYHGFVYDFFPASIGLITSGKAYIEAQKYGPLVSPGQRLITDVGDSLVEQVIPSIGGEYVPIQLFKNRDDNEIRVGRVLSNDNMVVSSLMRQGKSMNEIQMIMDNKNNIFVMEVTLFDNSLRSNMSSLNIGGNEADVLADQLTKMQINSETPHPLEQLSQEVKTNHVLLDKITHPNYFGNEIDVKVVFKPNLLGPRYYLNVSNNLGDIKIYNPVKTHYLVSYTRQINFKPNMVSIEKEPLQPGQTAFQIKHEKEFIRGQNKEVKMTKAQREQQDKMFRYFGVVKSGPYSGQRLEVGGYEPAHLAVTLSSTGRKVTSHVVRKRTHTGDVIIDEYDNPVFETSQIVPNDVFYLDLLLKNGNYAQVNKILPNGKISITEKIQTNGYSKREISEDEIQQLQPGFKFNEKEVKESKQVQEEMFIAGPSDVPEELQESLEEEDEGDSQEFDYAAASPAGEEGEEGVPKASFKDTQRTSIEQRELTSQQKRLRDEITGLLKLLKVADESIDIYATIDIVDGIIKHIMRKLKAINYTTDILVTSNIKFIIVCVVLYELIKSGFDKNMNTVISILFPSYFTIKDIQAQSMNENIFLMKWDDSLTQSKIDETVVNIRKYRQSESNYPKIINEIMINADIVLQSMLGLNVNIMDRSPIQLDNLIPLGINLATGKRLKEEAEEQDLRRGREASIRMRSEYVTVYDLLNDKPLPVTEVKIIWANIYQPILEKFEHEVQKKADTQNDLKSEYIYIKNNLFRAPFAIRDDPMKASVRKAFEGIYKTLLSTIIKQNLKIEKGKKRQRDEQETVRVNRSRIESTQPLEEEDEDTQPQHTKAYLREQAKRETQRSLMKATMSANRTAYMMKKQRKQEPTIDKSKDNEDLIKTVRNNEPWWNQMDTTE
jgi:hypothetical protein